VRHERLLAPAGFLLPRLPLDRIDAQFMKHASSEDS